jgi:hypothetical protein
MQSENRDALKERFAHLDLAQLEELLRQDWLADSNNLTAEQTLAILEVIEEKKSSGLNEDREAEVAAAWQSFKHHYLPLVEADETLYGATIRKTKSTKRCFIPPRLSWAAAIIVVFILSTSVFAYQVYGYNIFENIAQWTAEIFRLKAPVEPNDNLNENLGEDLFPDASDPRLQPVYATMKELEIPTTLAPTWIPERFDGHPIVETSTTPFKGVISAFIHESETLMLSFDYITKADTIYEKDDSLVTSLRINGVTYYFMSNNAQNRVVWSVDQFECSINGTVTYEELEQIVLSIYERR